MKIFCIGRNYIDHAKELNNPVPSEPLVFMKPPTALVVSNKPFFYPDFTQDLHYEGEIVLRVCKNGRSVQPEFAHRYYDAVGFGIDFTARDLQDKLKSKGHPWEIAKGFDGACPLSPFVALDPALDLAALGTRLVVNGRRRQHGSSAQMLTPIIELLCYASRQFSLWPGDVLLTGTPAGVGPLAPGDRITADLEGLLKVQTRVV